MEKKLIIEPGPKGEGKFTRITDGDIFVYFPEEFSKEFYTKLTLLFSPTEYKYYFYAKDQLLLPPLYTAYPGCPLELIAEDEIAFKLYGY